MSHLNVKKLYIPEEVRSKISSGSNYLKGSIFDEKSNPSKIHLKLLTINPKTVLNVVDVSVIEIPLNRNSFQKDAS